MSVFRRLLLGSRSRSLLTLSITKINSLRFQSAFSTVRSSVFSSWSPKAVSKPSSTFLNLSTKFRSFSSSSKSSAYYSQSSGNQLIRRINNLETNSILFAIISANVAVYLTWEYAKSVAQKFRDASLYKALGENFTTSMKNVKEGRVWCLILSTFSHESGGHILMNMVGLWFIGGPLIGTLGNVGFLSLYFFSGLSSSIFSLAFNSVYSKGPNSHASHGASGATYGSLAYFAAANPRSTFLLFFIVPVPAWLCVGGLFAWDTYSALGRRTGMTDSAGHMGGILAGLAFFFRRRFGF